MARRPGISALFIAALVALVLPALSCAMRSEPGSILTHIDGNRKHDHGLGSQVALFSDIDEDGTSDIIAVQHEKG